MAAPDPARKLPSVNYLDLAERSWPVLNRLMDVHTWVYRASGGRIGEHVPFVKAPMLLLDHVGARSGAHRTSALLYIADGDEVAIIASKGGFPKHPAWYHNLKANPRVRFLGPGGLTGDYVAHEAEGDERSRLWAEAVDYYDGFATYQGRTDGRRIPVVVLEPAR